MNNYFESIKKRCEKIADIILTEDIGKQMVSIEDIRGIVDNEAENYQKHIWNYLYKKQYPQNYYGLTDIWVIAKFKTPKENKPMDIVKYRFDCHHFYTADGVNVTKNIVAWTDIPEEDYDNTNNFK